MASRANHFQISESQYEQALRTADFIVSQIANQILSHVCRNQPRAGRQATCILTSARKLHEQCGAFVEIDIQLSPGSNRTYVSPPRNPQSKCRKKTFLSKAKKLIDKVDKFAKKYSVVVILQAADKTGALVRRYPRNEPVYIELTDSEESEEGEPSAVPKPDAPAVPKPDATVEGVPERSEEGERVPERSEEGEAIAVSKPDAKAAYISISSDTEDEGRVELSGSDYESAATKEKQKGKAKQIEIAQITEDEGRVELSGSDYESAATKEKEKGKAKQIEIAQITEDEGRVELSGSDYESAATKEKEKGKAKQIEIAQTEASLKEKGKAKQIETSPAHK